MTDQKLPENTAEPNAVNKLPPKKRFEGWRSLIIYAGILAVFYFGHVEIQSFLGARALDKVTLERLSLDQALERANATGKPILVEVSAIWCPSCRKLDLKVLSKPDVQQAIEAKFIFTRVELESETGEMMQKRYGVRGVPTLLVLDSNGNAAKKLQLTFDPATFKQILAQAR